VGNRGCLEAIASPVAVARLLESGRRQPVSIQDMLEMVAAGDRGARRAVADAGEAVGRAVADLVNILNPELVVVGGDLAQTGGVLLDPIAAGIERHSVAPAAASVRVCAGCSASGPRCSGPPRSCWPSRHARSWSSSTPDRLRFAPLTRGRAAARRF